MIQNREVKSKLDDLEKKNIKLIWKKRLTTDLINKYSFFNGSK